MARATLRDRFFRPQVARAMMSPSGLGLGAAAGVAAGVAAEPWVALPAAILGWSARVAVALPRGRSGPRIDPFTVVEPWRRFVQSALKARARASQAAEAAQAGPLHDRLVDITDRIDLAVAEVWSIARRGHELGQARKDLDPSGVRRRMARADPSAPTTAALGAQLESIERLDGVIEGAEARLQILQARLDEAAARTVELAVRADDRALGELGANLDGVVGEMEALRQALDETGGTTSGSG